MITDVKIVSGTSVARKALTAFQNVSGLLMPTGLMKNSHSTVHQITLFQEWKAVMKTNMKIEGGNSTAAE
uniref:Uncharacterized protein n=1 Tax=Anguilla anguilla TaxID=7936 RepID=A0A0E9TJ05_ANGAN